MTPDASNAAEILRPFIRILAEEIAPALAVALAESRQRGDIDQRCERELEALGLSPRAFLEAARDGAFPSTKRGRRVVARFEDVRAWREGTTARRAVVKSETHRDETRRDEADLERMRTALGLRGKRSRGAPKGA